MGQQRTGTKRARRKLGAEHSGSATRLGFTLTELLVVITIIGIIIAFLLNAAMDSVRAAELRATQSLIAKLESALNDRLDTLMKNLPTPNYTHGYLAGVYPGLPAPYNVEGDGLPLMLPSALLTNGLPNPKCTTLQRAQVIANFDYIKAEMPDVFFVDPAFLSLNNPASYNGYPVNFTGLPFAPQGSIVLNNFGQYMLPLGHMIQGPRNNPMTNPFPWGTGYGDSHVDPVTNNLISTHPELGYTGSGIYGASYSAAAGLYKNLGYGPQGYDMVDNNSNGLIDEYAEGLIGLSAQQQANLVSNLHSHTHNTARAEMLYAILVEGAGPLGSVFNRDDFTDKEVKDTDGDGLPEFVDAWGQPLQFFRWPLLYHSDIQRGQLFASSTSGSWTLLSPYAGQFDQREQDPLDVNQQLVASAWWSTVGTGNLRANFASPFGGFLPSNPPPGPVNVSGGAQFFSTFYHTLYEPMQLVGGGLDWDRSGQTSRRAFFSKFLVLSGGPDQVPGVFLYADADLKPPNSTNADAISVHLIANENLAMPFSTLDAQDFTKNATYNFAGYPTISGSPSSDPTHPSSYDLFIGAQDDITNQNIQAVGGIGGSG